MTDETVLLDIEDNIATLTLNRPEVRNAFDENMIIRLTQIFDELALRGDVSALVLCAKGKSFSAGADLEWMKRAANFTPEQNKGDALALADMLNKLNRLPQTTIACVQGAAMGGGLGLVSCCDIVIADEECVFALSEVKLGLIPATIGPYVIAAIGARQARCLFQTGERFDGKEAHRIGLVHKLAHRPENIDYQLHLVLKNLNANGPIAMKEAKKLALDLAEETKIMPELMDNTARRIAKIRTSDEAKEGLSAFLEKRKASWVKG